MIDDAKATILNSGGMMLVPIPQGRHEIVFHYQTPGARVGALVSLITIVIFAAGLAFSAGFRKREKRLDSTGDN